MSERDIYKPGPAAGAHIERHDKSYILVLVRQIDQSPAAVWQALTDPAQLQEWSPYDADADMSEVGRQVTLTTIGAPTAQVDRTTIDRADAPQLLAYKWGGNNLRWQLDATGSGTELRLYQEIDPRYIAMCAAGWHICLDVLRHLVEGRPIGRIVGADAMHFEWPRINAEYSKLLELQED